MWNRCLKFGVCGLQRHVDALKPFLGGTGNGSTSSPAEKGLKRSYEDFSGIDLLKTCPDFGNGLIFVCAIVSYLGYVIITK